MNNRKYLKQLCKAILDIDSENVYILEVANEVKKAKIKEIQYTVYIDDKINNSYLNKDIENIYPVTHTIDDTVYNYDNLTEEEILLLTEVLTTIDIRVSLISRKEFNERLFAIESQKNLLEDELLKLKLEINKLKSMDKHALAYDKYLVRKSLIGDMKKLKLIEIDRTEN